MGDTFDLAPGGGPVSFSGEIVDVGATPGDVLTIQDDGSVAAEAGGGSQSLTVIFPAGIGGAEDATTVTGVAVVVGDAFPKTINFTANVEGVMWAALGVIDSDGNFLGGSVFVQDQYGDYSNLYGFSDDAPQTGIDNPVLGGTGGTAYCPMQFNGVVTFFTDTVICENIPTADPAVAGALWSNLGIVTVSAG